MNIQFGNPWLLLFLLLASFHWSGSTVGWNPAPPHESVRFSDLGTSEPCQQPLGGGQEPYRRLPEVPLALALLVVALARPRSGITFEDVSSEGVDIVSDHGRFHQHAGRGPSPRGSNRLDVSREVVADFIGRRRHDRIGLVAFAAKAITRCPPTLDYRVLDTQVGTWKSAP